MLICVAIGNMQISMIGETLPNQRMWHSGIAVILTSLSGLKYT